MIDDTPTLPLCVDLDGTLIGGDLFIESLFAYILKAPWRVFAVLFWIMRGGKPRLKRELALRLPINTASLPYNTKLIEYLHQQRSRGQTLLLVSGSDQLYVESVSQHVGLFDEAIGSDGKRNFSGRGKARLLLERFGEKQFEYIGNSRQDLEVWKHAAKAIVVSDRPMLFAKASELCDDTEQQLPETPHSLAKLPKLIRMHQWSKNALVFVPLFLAHGWGNPDKVLASVLAFFGFSAAASIIYICNDLLDLEHDRLHPWKRQRVLAKGTFNIYHLFWVLPALFLVAIAAATFLPILFAITLVVYVAVTLTYSARLKEVVILDVMTLAVLYTLRLCAGAAATVVPISSWLLLFSIFLFLSLSLIKRYSELLELNNGTSRRGYQLQDLQLITSAGLASGYICSLVAILYVTSPEVTELYSSPILLWPVGILIVYWITRLWLFALRGQIREDPVVFTLKDKVSYRIGILCAALVILAAVL